MHGRAKAADKAARALGNLPTQLIAPCLEQIDVAELLHHPLASVRANAVLAVGHLPTCANPHMLSVVALLGDSSNKVPGHKCLIQLFGIMMVLFASPQVRLQALSAVGRLSGLAGPHLSQLANLLVSSTSSTSIRLAGMRAAARMPDHAVALLSPLGEVMRHCEPDLEQGRPALFKSPHVREGTALP